MFTLVASLLVIAMCSIVASSTQSFGGRLMLNSPERKLSEAVSSQLFLTRCRGGGGGALDEYDDSDQESDDDGDDDGGYFDNDEEYGGLGGIVENEDYQGGQDNDVHPILKKGLFAVVPPRTMRKASLVALLIILQFGGMRPSTTTLMNALWICIMLKRYFDVDLVDMAGFSSKGKSGNPYETVKPILAKHEQRFCFGDLRKETVKDAASFHCALSGERSVKVLKKQPRSTKNETLEEADAVESDSFVPRNATLALLHDMSLDAGLVVGDVKNAVDSILAIHRSREAKDVTEVVIRLESSGGEVTAFGAASNQLQRLRNEERIILTVIIDRVGASGGYMLGCIATEGRLFSSPFAYVGSIGVVGEILNFHRLLDRLSVDSLTMTSGEDKMPLSPVREITDEGKAKTQEVRVKAPSYFIFIFFS